MSLKMNRSQLVDLLRDFYVLTGIKIVIFDDNFKQVISYPADHCDLCAIIRQDPTRASCCVQADQRSFTICKQTDELVIYKCHAGLFEATAPIKSRGVIIGYIMFGQISDSKDKEELAAGVIRHFSIGPEEADAWRQAAAKIKYKNITQIKAASKILESLTYYVLSKDLVSPAHERLIDRVNQYIEDNLDHDIPVASLASAFQTSRTKMYEIMRKNTGMGIAGYIQQKRMEKAKILLKSTDEAISQIAGETGYSDYSYFSKAFKKEYGLTPREYRMKYSVT